MPTPKSIEGRTFVELPVSASNAEPAWQAYALTVREMGAPHVVEIELPADARQQLAVSVIEPDTSGRVQSFGREAGVYVDRETGEELKPVTRVLPLAPSPSSLLRAPENLLECRRCKQLIGIDLSDCPHCGLRQEATNGDS